VTTGKLQSLDANGDGEVSLQELVDSLDAQAKQKHQLFLQRCVIIAGMLLLVCSFGLSLGSSVLSFMLMTQLEVHGGALTDREGHVLGSEPRNPTVNNVTVGEAAAARRLESSGSGDYTMPADDFKEALAKYKAGSIGFVVPIADTMVTVQVENAGPLQAHGRTSAGQEWHASCEADASHCSVELHARAALPANTDADHTDAGRRLFWGKFTNGCDFDGWEVGACVDLQWGVKKRNPSCGTNWCFSSCCYPNHRGYAAGVAEDFLTWGDGITECFATFNGDDCVNQGIR
jgi:hypothetical protein